MVISPQVIELIKRYIPKSLIPIIKNMSKTQLLLKAKLQINNFLENNINNIYQEIQKI